MRFVLVFRDAGQVDARREAMDEDDRREELARLDAWCLCHAGRILHRCSLKPVFSATTIRGREARFVDGPYCSEASAISGYVEVEVDGREQAVALAATWPYASTVEIRPLC